MKSYWLVVILFITTFIKISGQREAEFLPSVYTKPLPINITFNNQPIDFKFTTHLVNIKIPEDSANIWNEEIERRYIRRLFDYIKDVDFLILNYSGFYFNDTLGLGSLTRGVAHYFNIQNAIKNIGFPLINNSNLYNSSKLLGITRLTENFSLRPQNVTHELYHHWNSYLESALYWLVDPSHHTGLVEDNNTVFYGQGHYWDFQHLHDSIYSFKGGFCTGFPGKLEGYLAGLWDMPDSLRTLKNYYNYPDLPYDSSIGEDGVVYTIQQVKADSIVVLKKARLFSMYGGERTPNYLNSNNNYDCAIIVFSLQDFLNDNKLKGFHYASVLNGSEGSATEYNNLYDQIFYGGTPYMNADYGTRETNPYHSSYKKLHFNTALSQIITEVEKISESNSVAIYPNPNSGNFTIEFNNSYKGEITINIHSLTGTQLKISKIDKTTDVMNYFIDLGNVEAGVYFVDLITAKEKVIKKIIIN